MKKVLSYILIVFVVFANLFAPFAVGLGEKNSVKITENRAEAMSYFLDGTDTLPIKIMIDPEANDHKIKFTLTVTWKDKSLLSNESVYVGLLSKEQKDPKNPSYDKYLKVSFPMDGKETQIGEVIFPDLKASTSYNFDVVGYQNNDSIFQSTINATNLIVYNLTLGLWDAGSVHNTGIVKNAEPYTVTTLSEGTTKFQKQEISDTGIANDAAMLPTCALNNLGGCVGIILYRLVFQPSSALFALTGKALDYTFNYSIKDTSYRSQFVTQGWGIVRDFCNLFFIFVLLYIAFGTILNLHNVKTKEMIINVVIIGLFINFSLFTTQIIIDTSNILARVFYNNLEIGTKDANGVVQEKLGAFGEKQISATIVKKVNPQKIIIQAANGSKIQTKDFDAVNASGDQANGVVDNATFIIVTILASIMNIVGLIVFLSMSLILITRVIGLWLAMIFVPAAFFTYIIPQAQGVDMVGWKNWWPNTLKLAFLAPVFMFFMYLIVKFLETGLGVIDASNKNGMDFFIATLVPFAFLMILLWQAKKIASDMSGKLGQSITGGLAALGGLALGGAALGGAFLGRRMIGNPMKMATQSQETRDAAIAKGKLYNPATWGKYLSAKMGNVPHNFETGKDKKDAHGNVVLDANGKAVKETYGDKLMASQRNVRNVEHSKQVLDEKVKSMHMGDSYDNSITSEDKEKVLESVNKDLISKKLGFGGDYSKITDKNKKKEVDDAYDTKKYLNKTEESYVEHNASQMEKDLGTKVAMGEFVGALRKGTYDMRNISQLTTKSKGFPKAAVGLAAVVASGVRMGLKSGAGVDHGKGQGDFLKDLTGTITSALKGVKIEVPSGGGGGGGHDAHGGGGHDAHGGGGHH